MSFKHRWVMALAGLGMVGAAAHPAAAQPSESDVFLNQQREIDDRIRAELAQRPVLEQKFQLDYGGWVDSFVFIWDDGIESSRTLRRTDLRVWGRLNLQGGAHEFYGRGRLSYLDYNTGDSPTGRDNDWDGMNLERGYYQFDLRRLIRYEEQREIDYNLRFKVGRDLVEWGTGYAISLPLDHVAVTGELANVEVTGLIGQPPSSYNGPDYSRPGDGNDREFFGGLATYKGLKHHEPFVYVMYVDDHMRRRWPDRPLQQYEYDSLYIGMGSRGELSEYLFYSTEWVLERGKSFGDRRFLHRREIKAWGFDAELRYLPPWKLHPEFSLEYMFASGDADRTGSPTDAIGGNSHGNDESFVAFGYRDTGLAFAPRLSNIHIWRGGAGFYPFEETRNFKNIQWGTNVFLYHKNRSDGAVSDPTADLPSGYLGWEFDLYHNWRLTSDLSWTVRYGVFFPGDAFSDQTTRTFFLTGLTWSF